MRIAKRGENIPSGAWQATDTTWGESQRVRLVTGPLSLVEDFSHVRSVHAVPFLEREANRVLLVENRDSTWTFPGGRLEGTETIEEALARELWEEAGAILAPNHFPIAVTRVDFLNRLPDRIYRVHPSFLLWVVGRIVTLTDDPCHDPAPGGVLSRKVCTITEAKDLLGGLELCVLDVASHVWQEKCP